MNLLPPPNATGSGYNFVSGTQHSASAPPAPPASRLPADQQRQPGERADVVDEAGRAQRRRCIGTVGSGPAAHDFTANQTKFDYTRILDNRTVLELGRKFYSTELGPPEDDRALAGIQRTTYPALANLPQFASMHNPFNLIPRVQFGTLQSVGGGAEAPNITYDGRWPITGADTALAFMGTLTAYAWCAYVQDGLRPRARAASRRPFSHVCR